MPKLSAYQLIGVIAPGTVVVVAILILFPETGVLIDQDISIGDFGLIVILALVVGHLIQAVGNIFEFLFWFPQGGMPTRWPSKNKTNLIAPKQLERLAEAVRAEFGMELSELAKGRGPTREMFVFVRQHGRTDRIDIFNENYGLLRGIASGFLVTAGLAWYADPSTIGIIVLLVLASSVAAYRMKHFGEHYARELFIEYLRSREADDEAASCSSG